MFRCPSIEQVSEPDQPDRPRNQPVYVRQPARGRQTEDMAVEGTLVAWVRRFEFGAWGWRARVEVGEQTRVVPVSWVLPRDG